MNLMPPGARPMPATTRAAEGLPRRRFTVAELEAMVAAGILDEKERFELIGGDVVPMSPKGNRHEVLKVALMIHWAGNVPEGIRFAQETTFRISADTFLEPDFVFYRKSDGLMKLKPDTALFVAEVADSSLGYDVGRKSKLYASLGVREVWIFDAVRLKVHIHRSPGPDGYLDKRIVEDDEAIAPQFAPAMTVVLKGLELV